MRARPTGNSGETATATTAAAAAPAAPITAARATPAASSWRGLMPSARRVPKSSASSELWRASNWPATSTPMTPSSSASSQRATACRWMERSVLTDWVASGYVSGGLP
jgi:hypothetical protein